MKHRRIPPTTHTVEMAQIAEFNARLDEQPPPEITAADVGLEGAPVGHRRGAGVLPGAAVLDRVVWDGAPEFPNIHAHFVPPGDPTHVLVVDLHTAALRALSSRLGLHHVWGVGG